MKIKLANVFLDFIRIGNLYRSSITIKLLYDEHYKNQIILIEYSLFENENALFDDVHK